MSFHLLRRPAISSNEGGATRGFHNRIAIVFDFDRTLSSGTIDALLDRMGVENNSHWREERLAPMIQDGWDEILAKADLLARTAAEQGCSLTRDLVVEVGRSLEAYPGVEETLAQLRKIGFEAGEGAEVELCAFFGLRRHDGRSAGRQMLRRYLGLVVSLG